MIQQQPFELPIKPFFEYCHCPKESSDGVKTLVVSFPGRKSNLLYGSSLEEFHPFLWDTLNKCSASTLFMRSVYNGDPSSANITDDYDLLPDFLRKFRKAHSIDRLILFGFSLGCGPCLWLAKQNVADEVVLISPGEPILPTLSIIDDMRWQKDFESFYGHGEFSQIKKFPLGIKIKIIHGLNLEPDRQRECNLVHYIKHLAPQSELVSIQNTGHYIPQHWKDQGILNEKIFEALTVQENTQTDLYPEENWAKLDNISFDHNKTIENKEPSMISAYK